MGTRAACAPRTAPRRRPGAWLALVLWLASFAVSGAAADGWRELAPGVLRAAGMPAGYALTDGAAAVLIGAPRSSDRAALRARGLTVELALLTHHHRDSCEQAADWVREGVPVRAGKMSAAWLSPEAVANFWDKSMPRATPGRFPPLFERFWGQWNYFVQPAGSAGVSFDLEDGAVIAWRGWRIEVVATPGHSRDHLAFVARRGTSEQGRGQLVPATPVGTSRPHPEGQGSDAPVVVFCGDALAAAGKIWAPFTLDWHHVNSDGQQAASDSLRRLAATRPTLLCPEHGDAILTNTVAALTLTAERLERLALLKSFERYTKESVGEPPAYSFLAIDQVASPNPQGNPQPWTRLLPHLYLTGNTYALASKDGPVLLVDAYSLNLTQRVAELKRDFGLGPVEVVTVSHAHNDHYTGIFALAERERFAVWALDRIADVISDPWRFRAPYVDARPVSVARRLADGEEVAWREYRLRARHHPGQTIFGMGLEVTVDGKRCVFTGDNFYHAGQYTGSGGWSALNRGLPRGYERTARRILEARPDWMLAEHGGAFAFNEEDFRRRVRWAVDAAVAADAISLSGDHEWDWDLHRVRVEPHIAAVGAGKKLTAELVVTNPSARERRFKVRLARPEIIEAVEAEIVVAAGAEKRQALAFALAPGIPAGRHIVPGDVQVDGEADPVDLFFVVIVPEVAGSGR
ncbi:hypothetical protein LBMAG56_02660 [Verrucomicrobiota bacterium]|nr:hypothetical protein LBMAG56_02660 [Verrucomicrobiota bacterium]